MRIRVFALSLATLALLSLVPSVSAQSQDVLSARKALVAATQAKKDRKAAVMKRFEAAQAVRKDKQLAMQGQAHATRGKAALRGPAQLGPKAAAAREELARHRVAPPSSQGIRGGGAMVGRHVAIQKARGTAAPSHRGAPVPASAATAPRVR